MIGGEGGDFGFVFREIDEVAGLFGDRFERSWRSFVHESLVVVVVGVVVAHSQVSRSSSQCGQMGESSGFGSGGLSQLAGWHSNGSLIGVWFVYFAEGLN